ncbi:MAG: hypothetical protein M9928_04090 [Anaerolineae bacterium]|nr:hypothetical protein [Anaerolineae bacterium]
MNYSKLIRAGLLLAIVAAGIWLLSTAVSPAVELASRESAVQAFAPGITGSLSDQELSADQVAYSVSSPIVVNMSDIPTGVYDPDNQLARWQRGDLDMMENEGIRNSAEMAAMRAASEKLEPSTVLQRQALSVVPQAATAGVAFDSLDYNDCCGGGGNVPPDPELAVGPNHIIAAVNVAFEIYNTNGNLLVGPITFASFMAGDSNCTGVFDPNANYDEKADRFVLGIDADGTHFCIAVSQTGDPTGAWNIYSFDTSPSRRDFFDYPHTGIGDDAIYMGANIFSGNRFGHARVWAFDKAAMYAGQSAAAVSVSLGSNDDTPQPLNLHGYAQGTWPSGGPHYILTEKGYNGADYTVYAWDDPFGANNFSTVGTVDLVAATGVAAGMPVDTPQLGGQTIQANDFRPQDFEYRNGYAWTANTIACNPGGGTVNCVRWAKINPATATVVDAGVFGTNGEYRTFADLAVNHCDDMQIGYSKSSSSMYPAVFVTGRQSTDPAGTLQSEVQMKAGEITYTSFESSAPRRWGDYTEMTIAPNGTTFWYLGEYSKNTGTSNGRWGTYIGSYSYNCSGGPAPTPTPGPTATPVPTPAPTATPAPGGTMHVEALSGATSSSNGGKWNAIITVTIGDAGHGAVANATVTGVWSSGANGSGSCVTNASGQCDIVKNNINKNSSSATFTVTDVTHASNSYDSGANHVNSITVTKP